METGSKTSGGGSPFRVIAGGKHLWGKLAVPPESDGWMLSGADVL